MPMDDSTTSPLHCPLRHPWPHLRGRVRDNHRRPSPDPIPAFDAGFTPELLLSKTHTHTHIHGLAKPTGPRCQEDTGSAATLTTLVAMPSHHRAPLRELASGEHAAARVAKEVGRRSSSRLDLFHHEPGGEKEGGHSPPWTQSTMDPVCGPWTHTTVSRSHVHSLDQAR